MSKFSIRQAGQSLIEIILAMGLSAIILPALLTGLVSSRQGKVQQSQRTQAVYFLNETIDAVRSAREKDWVSFAVDGAYHISTASGSSWTLVPGATTSAGFTQQVIIDDVNRDSTGAIVSSGGTLDPSSKKVDVLISWDQPYLSTVSATLYMTRYLSNNSFVQTLGRRTPPADFDLGVSSSTQITNTAGGEVILINNNRAKWCSPELSASTIDLPDGPPVAVSAVANVGTVSIPNDVFVAIAPFATTSSKLAYVTVAANADPPAPTLQGTFTLDPSKYSDAGLVPVGIDLTNSFKTNDVKYYKSPAGKLYALLATDLPDHEVVAIQINDGAGNSFQDPINKIYKYWTFFNTRIYGIGTGMDTGFLDPSANAAETTNAGDNDGYGTNPTRAYSDNSSFAVDTNSGSGTGTDCLGIDKDKHRFYNYNFSLPTGTVIDGIEVRLDARADSTTGNPKMCVQLSWDGGTTWTDAKSTSTLTTSEATYTLGGAADTWGRTWSSTNFTNANFRVRIIDVASNTSRDFSLDWAAVKIYYSGGVLSTNDQAPFNYGATTLTVLADKGYITSGGYLYVFDLSNIDSKTPTDGLNMIGCRIELDGYDCQPGNGTDRKYSAGETGTTWSSTTTPVNPDTCYDGGNIELYATNDAYPVQVGADTYIFIAIGAATDPELGIVNVTNIPTGSTSPVISNNSCGRISGGNSGWKRISTLDFNSKSGSQEAANSVYAKSDGTRAYISSNGGVDANVDGLPDSKQFYVINTTNKSSPAFLSGVPGSPSYGPLSGFYYGTGANTEMYPKRSLTVLNGDRVVLVGRDSLPANGNDAQEYQVLNSSDEASPAYCGGINYDEGFNDLTSVSEADGDNFVYMIANTMERQLKIIQGGPDTGIYADSGMFESSIFDAILPNSFYHFDATVSQPASTEIKAQVAVAPPVGGVCTSAVFNYVGPNGEAGSYFAANAGIISGTIPFGTYGGYENPNRCFRLKFFLSTTDANQTPTLYDFTVNYSP
jgi:type II secretory pathway pseudopilin PulG